MRVCLIGDWGADPDSQDVQAMRVMLADGTVHELERGDGEMHNWLGSFGLLGVITAVRMQLEKKVAVMDTLTSEFGGADGAWNRENVLAWLALQRETSDAGVFFFNPYTRQIFMIGQRKVDQADGLPRNMSQAVFDAEYGRQEELYGSLETLRYTGTGIGVATRGAVGTLLANANDNAVSIYGSLAISSLVLNTIAGMFSNHPSIDAGAPSDGYFLTNGALAD